jgi:hypothetical protein
MLLVVALTSVGCASLPGSAPEPSQAILAPVGLLLAGTGTPDDAIIGAVDAATARADWPLTIRLLEQLLNRDPTSVQYKARLYEAHVALGHVDLGQKKAESARIEFAIARSIDPQRANAAAALQPTSDAP